MSEGSGVRYEVYYHEYARNRAQHFPGFWPFLAFLDIVLVLGVSVFLLRGSQGQGMSVGHVLSCWKGPECHIMYNITDTHATNVQYFGHSGAIFGDFWS